MQPGPPARAGAAGRHGTTSQGRDRGSPPAVRAPCPSSQSSCNSLALVRAALAPVGHHVVNVCKAVALIGGQSRRSAAASRTLGSRPCGPARVRAFGGAPLVLGGQDVELGGIVIVLQRLTSAVARWWEIDQHRVNLM